MPSQTGHSQIAGLAGWFIVTFLAAIVGAAASLHAKVVYIHLFKPAMGASGRNLRTGLDLSLSAHGCRGLAGLAGQRIC